MQNIKSVVELKVLRVNFFFFENLETFLLIVGTSSLFVWVSVYGQDPDFIREGGSIPVTLSLQEATGKNVILLSLGCGDDGAHSQNEKMDRRNYIEGVIHRSIVLFSSVF